eukprot:6196322-Pleurochrysis_carterae.AAC.1
MSRCSLRQRCTVMKSDSPWNKSVSPPDRGRAQREAQRAHLTKLAFALFEQGRECSGCCKGRTVLLRCLLAVVGIYAPAASTVPSRP